MELGKLRLSPLAPALARGRVEGGGRGGSESAENRKVRASERERASRHIKTHDAKIEQQATPPSHAAQPMAASAFSFY